MKPYGDETLLQGICLVLPQADLTSFEFYFHSREKLELGTKSKDFSESLGVPPEHCAL